MLSLILSEVCIGNGIGFGNRREFSGREEENSDAAQLRRKSKVRRFLLHFMFREFPYEESSLAQTKYKQ